MSNGYSPTRKISSGLVIMAMAGFVMAVLGMEIAADLALDNEGEKYYARVLRKHVSYSTRRYRTSSSYIVEFRFQPKGTSLLGRDAVEKDVYDRIRPGQGLDIWYLKAYPEIHRIGAAPPYGLRAGVFVLFFVVFGLAFYMVLTAFR